MTPKDELREDEFEDDLEEDSVSSFVQRSPKTKRPNGKDEEPEQYDNQVELFSASKPRRGLLAKIGDFISNVINKNSESVSENTESKRSRGVRISNFLSGLWNSFSISRLFRRGDSDEKVDLAQTPEAPRGQLEVKSHSGSEEGRGEGLGKSQQAEARNLGAKIRGKEPTRSGGLEADIDEAGADFPLNISKAYKNHYKKTRARRSTPTQIKDELGV